MNGIEGLKAEAKGEEYQNDNIFDRHDRCCNLPLSGK
jgi:hypothetical protein